LFRNGSDRPIMDEMTSTSEPGPERSTVAASHLRGLLELARLVQRDPALPEVLAAAARTVAETLGFATVVINLYRPKTGDYEVATVHGNARARELLLGQVDSPESWSAMLDPRFLRSGAYFIPDGAIEWDHTIATYVPELAPHDGADESAWRADDALFVALDGSSGRHYGIISVDEPVSGRRPGEQELEVLNAVAAHAALAIEASHQFAALQGALARKRAVIESSLDAVIAVDRRGRVLEFNPAAERMFGYRSEEALGREVAELVIPPETRGRYRLGLERGIRHGDWPLLGRRIETTALRADGSRVPVELALTPARGDDEDDDGPVVYGFVRDISERRRGQEQLAYLAYHDPLTGLPNRILVEQQLDLALARARRAEGSVVLMFVDLDDFKEVNDRLGHAAGDRLLASVSTRLRGALRESDLLARQGGDEFIVLLSDLPEDSGPSAELVGGKLLDSLREPFVVAGSELRTSASIGISVYPDDAADAEALLRHADIAMYAAKAAGGGRLAFHQQPRESRPRRTSLSSQLRRAIERSELELHYQPIWQIGSERGIYGVEALLRWRHPDRGLLTPDAFMSLAEQGSAGDELIDWVLGECCGQARDWQRLGLRTRLSMNVSPHQLLAPGYVGRFVAQVDDHELDAEDLMIELTESAWTVDAAQTLAVIAQLRAAGTRLAIDDFGAGYSSLSRLRELDFDVIKIDRGLLTGVPADPTATAVLRAIFGLAQACGCAVIAEGVVAEEQVIYLAENGIDRVQGFLFGYPVVAHQLTPVLRERLIARQPAA